MAAALRFSGPAASNAIASLVLLAVAVAVLAFAVPLAADGVGALASGAWPWWLVPLGDRVRKARQRRWQSPADLSAKAVRARDSTKKLRRGKKLRQELRAARLDARSDAAPDRPEHVTWCGDRFAAARRHIQEQAGLEITTAWTALLLVLPDGAPTALTDGRDSYDAACEAIVWSVALILLGGWWWPALPAGLVLATVSWRWLRRAVTAFCATAEAVAVQHAAELKSAAP